MGQSNRPRLRELRSIYYLVGECCELGADPIAWRQHLVETLTSLLGAQVAIHTESVVAAPYGQPGWLRPVYVIDTGWPTASDRQSLEQFMAQGKPELGPFVPDMFDPPVRIKVFHPRGRVGEKAWHESLFYNEFVRPAHLDDWFHAHHLNEQGQVFWVSVNRASEDRPFQERQRRLLSLLFHEITMHWGGRLAKLEAPSVYTLAPRLQQVLRCLLEGDSEKQVALQLGISPHTVHHYVKDLHRRFGVSSRGELLAHSRPYWEVLRKLASESEGTPEH